jgi:hypothetical protein
MQVKDPPTSLPLPLFLWFFGISQILDCTSHPSGSRSRGREVAQRRDKVSLGAEQLRLFPDDPWPMHGPQKIFGTIPCPIPFDKSAGSIANLSWFTAWAVRMLVDLVFMNGTVYQSNLVVFPTPMLDPHPIHAKSFSGLKGI